MKNLFTTLFTLFTLLALFLLTPASASTFELGASSKLDALGQPLVCAEEKKKKKEGEEDEEPECD